MALRYKVNRISEDEEGFIVNFKPDPPEGARTFVSFSDTLDIRYKQRPGFTIGQKVTLTIS